MARRARSVCMPELALKTAVPARTQHYAESVASRLRVLKIAAGSAPCIRVAFGIFQLTLGGRLWWLGCSTSCSRRCSWRSRGCTGSAS